MANPDINAAIDAIAARVATAAAALTPAIADVYRGDPVPGPGESIRVWYAGEVDTPKFTGGTLNSDLRGEKAVVTCYFPVSTSTQAVATARDQRIFLLKDGIRRGILAGSTLGGTVTDLEIPDAASTFAEFGGTPYRVLELEVLMAFTEYPIAQ